MKIIIEEAATEFCWGDDTDYYTPITREFGMKAFEAGAIFLCEQAIYAHYKSCPFLCDRICSKDSRHCAIRLEKPCDYVADFIAELDNPKPQC